MCREFWYQGMIHLAGVPLAPQFHAANRTTLVLGIPLHSRPCARVLETI